MRYKGVNVLVTGGLGFIGSNLAIRLVEEGAKVTIVDSSLSGCGGNEYNIAAIRDRVHVLHQDIADADRFADVIAGSQVVFNLAGEISHIHSMQFPERDLQVNTIAQLRFLLECKRVARGVRIVYAGTRQIYGVPRYLPIDEAHPIQPVDFNGVHKSAATMYHSMMTRAGDIDAIVLGLTNVYGPRMALDVVCQGFLSNFLRRAILKLPLEVFGDGTQLRDPIYVDDAVEAFLLAGVVAKPQSRTYNVGSPAGLTLNQIAHIIANTAGGPEPVHLPFPEERRGIDIGSYRTDSRRIARDLNWTMRTGFAEGIARTLEFYSRELPHYLDANEPHPACKMAEHSGAARRLSYAEIQ